MREPTEKFVVRLPKRLRNQLWEISRLYRRSMNAEIVIRLEFTLNGIPNQALEKAIEPAMFPHIERVLRGDLTKEEELLILAFRRLSAAQRAALVQLLC
jgi:hypothetical protein